ncbi:aminotransferase family protein-like protein [Xylariaceae sp. FL0016]|nr:aminotransferase family protein-like protein [Xylariaceae sp. FL0016]
MPPFGRAMRDAHFSFAPSYTPLNHGSFGAFPHAVQHYQLLLRRETEARPDTFIRFRYPGLLREAREAIAPLLGAKTDEVVFVPNALTGINTALRNLTYQDGDVIIYFSTIYGSCLKTIESLAETTPVRGFPIELTYPVEDGDILDMFRTALLMIQIQGRRPRVAMFDTVLTFPGVRFPWEMLVETCKDYGILSCVDGAHGVGHIDLTHTAQTGPDFFISSCYKWLMVPRGCAILHVPFRNHHWIKTSYPTAEGYLPERERPDSHTAYFVGLFDKVSTVDTSPYLSVPESLRFRDQVCGGEKALRDYSIRLARDGGKLMAEMMQTEVLENKSQTLGDCCFTNVRLPLDISQIATDTCKRDGVSSDVSHTKARTVADWITERSVNEFDSFLATRYYAGGFWTRLSSQIYLEQADFEWAARVLTELCNRVKRGEWERRR